MWGRYFFILFLFILPAASQANPIEGPNIENELLNFINKDSRVISLIESFESQAHTRKTLKSIFYKVHNKFLKEYKSHASISDLVADGEYDCLTGTILFVHILKKLDYSFEIVELDYHIYLTVYLEEGEVLIESTDPIYGFVFGNQVQKRISEYMDDQDDPTYSRRVDLSEIPGLLLYNQSVFQFNQMNFVGAFNTLVEAFEYSRTPKMKKLLKLSIAHLVNDSSLSEDDLRGFLNTYMNIVRPNPLVYLNH